MGAPLAVDSLLARRLILAPISAKGAQELIAPGTPVSATGGGCKGEGAHERGPDHDCGETEVGDEPGSYEVRLEVGGAHE